MGLHIKSVIFLVLVVGFYITNATTTATTTTTTTEKPCLTKMCLCDVNRHCKNEMKITPIDCSEESKGLQCLEKLTKHSECGPHQNETSILYRQFKGIQLADYVVCRYVEMHSEYKIKPHCWFPAVQCSQFLAFDRASNKQFCYERKLVMDLCKAMDYLPNDCKDLHVKFLDALYDATTCSSYHNK
uniref:DUF19 domain-containing protein n=1 Tax=Strigamia maritima TaxID=126957 RepID=T1J9W6_STRMM